MGVIKDHYSKLHESQKQKSQDFLKVLSLLIGFTLLFFFLILLPYVYLQQTDTIASNALDNVTHQVMENQRQIDHYAKVQGAIENLSQEIESAPTTLIEYINMLPNVTEFDPMAQEPLPAVELFSSCDDLNRTSLDFKRCNVNEKAVQLIKGYNNTIFENVIGPLQEDSPELFDITKLRQKTQSLIDSFKKITLSLDITKSVQNKMNVADEQKRQFEGFWSEFGSIIGKEINRINSTQVKLEENKTILEINKKDVGSAKSNITHRLDEVQFPLGKIPIGINEAISLFPLGIIAGFIISTISLSQSIILRKRYHDHVKQDRRKQIPTGKMIKEELPIWIDPVSPWYIQIAKSAVILIPFVIFLMSWTLILQSWSMNDKALVENILFSNVQTNQSVFSLAYGIILVLFICCYIVIAKEWFSYGNLYWRYKNINPDF